MTILRVFLARLAGLFGRDRRDRALDDEIQAHLDLMADDLVGQGMSPADARIAARRALGRVEPVKEIYRDQRGLPIVDALRQDVRFAVRLLGRRRGFTLAVVGTLGIGIGVNTTFFTIVNAICLRGVPIVRPADVLVVRTVDPSGRHAGMSYQDFEDVRRATASFAALAAYADAPMTIADDGVAAERVTGTYVSAGVFQLLGRAPVVGRELTADEDRAVASAVALISDDLWANRYGRNADVVGRTVVLNGAPATVIGIVPARFRFPVNSDVWLPLAAMPGLAVQPRDRRTLTVVGRLGSARTADVVRAELESIGARLAASFPATNRDVRLTPTPINDVVNGRITDGVWIAFITAGVIVLLVSWANVANLYLLRSTARTRELAIRTSIGASRSRLVRQLLVECALLSALGGGLGLTFSILATRLLASSVPAVAPLPFWIDFSLDYRVLAVVLATSAAAVFVCGLVPALHSTDVKLPRALRLGAQLGTPPVRTRWLTSGFLAAELGLAFVLVVNVAMAMQGAWNRDRRPVVDPTPLLTAAITLAGDRYETAGARSTFHAVLEARLRALPDVAAATVADNLPLLGAGRRELSIEGREAASGTKPVTVDVVAVGDGYFETVGLAVSTGRTFNDRDGLPGQESVLVNQRFADVHFPGATAVGQRLRLSDAGTTTPSPWQTIVGVVPTIREWSTDDGDPAVYQPLRRRAPRTGALLIRVRQGDPSAAAPAVREVVRQLDPNLPLYRVRTYEQALDDSAWNGRVSARIILTISTVAFLLALAGQFVVTAQSVNQRTQEIGLRIAVGAGSMRIVRLVLGRALLQVAGGLAFGVGLLYVLGRIFPAPDSWEDARAVTMAAALIAAVALASCVVPALRAARVDPVKALKAE